MSINLYDKRDDFNFKIINYPSLDGDVPISLSYGVFIAQLIRFARICTDVKNFSSRSKLMTQKLLKQGFRYSKLRKTFSKFVNGHYNLISKYNSSLKSLIANSIAHPEFYSDVLRKIRKITMFPAGSWADRLNELLGFYLNRGYKGNILKSTCLLVFEDEYLKQNIALNIASFHN